MKNLLRTLIIAVLTIAITSHAAPPTDKSIEKVLELSKAGKTMDDMWSYMDGIMKTSMEQATKGKPLTTEEKAVMDKYMKKMVAIMKDELSWEKLKPEFVKIYRDTFTQEEVNGLIAFYQSPTGIAFVEKQPEMMKQTMAVMQGRMGPMMQKIQQMTKEMTKEMEALKAKK